MQNEINMREQLEALATEKVTWESLKRIIEAINNNKQKRSDFFEAVNALTLTQQENVFDAGLADINQFTKAFRKYAVVTKPIKRDEFALANPNRAVAELIHALKGFPLKFKLLYPDAEHVFVGQPKLHTNRRESDTTEPVRKEFYTLNPAFKLLSIDFEAYFKTREEKFFKGGKWIVYRPYSSDQRKGLHFTSVLYLLAHSRLDQLGSVKNFMHIKSYSVLNLEKDAKIFFGALGNSKYVKHLQTLSAICDDENEFQSIQFAAQFYLFVLSEKTKLLKTHQKITSKSKLVDNREKSRLGIHEVEFIHHGFTKFLQDYLKSDATFLNMPNEVSDSDQSQLYFKLHSLATCYQVTRLIYTHPVDETTYLSEKSSIDRLIINTGHQQANHNAYFHSVLESISDPLMRLYSPFQALFEVGKISDDYKVIFTSLYTHYLKQHRDIVKLVKPVNKAFSEKAALNHLASNNNINGSMPGFLI